MSIDGRIRNLENIVYAQASAGVSAEEQRLFYRGLHAHLADRDLFMWGVRCEEKLFGGVSPELQAEGEALLSTRPATCRAMIEAADFDGYRKAVIEHGRYLESAGIPAGCTCSFCRGDAPELPQERSAFPEREEAAAGDSAEEGQ